MAVMIGIIEVLRNAEVIGSVCNKFFSTTDAKINGKPISPPPKTADETFFVIVFDFLWSFFIILLLVLSLLYDMEIPAKSFDFLWNSAKVTMCLVFHTAIMS